ncbi:MAG: aldo/keto reductase [Polyangiaceae bacterium]|nr:aldo/keto reductase [Polyangiaceae bacterium]
MTELFEKTTLGRSGLQVSKLGIGSSFGVSVGACRKAFDAGVNYFFWGSIRTPPMATAIREISLTKREDLVVVIESYSRAFWVKRSLEKALKITGLDYADILLLGWHDKPPCKRLLDAAEDLREKGKFKHLAISSHNRKLFPQITDDPRYDVFHVRYNAAHPGAEQDVFPHLGTNAPGIVAFTSTCWGQLLKQKNMPEGYTAPSATDCYRFSMSNPNVHVATCGPKNDSELDTALKALEMGKMDEDELDRMRKIGAHVRGRRSFMGLFT